MNIGIFSLGTGYKDASGTGTFLLEMMRRLSEDHHVHFITSGSGPFRLEISDLDVTVVQIPTVRKTSDLTKVATGIGLKPAEIETLSALPRVRPLKRYVDKNIDVVSTHYYIDNIIISNLLSIPTVFRFPGIKTDSVRWKAMARLAKPEIYLANSQSTAERVRNWLNLDVDGTVYPGVDLEQFSPDAKPAFECERIAILFVGRLDEGKGLFELLEAQSQLGKRTKLYLVGDGTLDEDLREEVHHLGIEDDVVFVGPVSHDNVHQYYAAADIFCLPSHHESFGMVNIEAMACETPVVSTKIDAIEEYLVDEVNGLLVDPGDADALTMALARLVEDADLREQLADGALERARELSWERQAKLMEKFYEKAR